VTFRSAQHGPTTTHRSAPSFSSQGFAPCDGRKTAAPLSEKGGALWSLFLNAMKERPAAAWSHPGYPVHRALVPTQ